ncbi:TolC family protein [Hymenobacter qilianensis]|uniref:TolC family protein n=1 Tax=Hymenobacter qilianensis TaxID=1385715 RepID=A0A7H0GXQ8_9BACT|nr:TolC family protein [Hymenobacter qilianensis]QNP53074.1 TolC family protein [Hymenobacter qilianensis]
MKNTFRLLMLAVVLSFLGLHQLLAQTPSTGQSPASSAPMALSLQQAIDYALQNKSTLQSQRLNEQIASARVNEVKASGLPQINIGAA